jgi:hypothetical protein
VDNGSEKGVGSRVSGRVVDGVTNVGGVWWHGCGDGGDGGEGQPQWRHDVQEREERRGGSLTSGPHPGFQTNSNHQILFKLGSLEK